MEILSTLSDQLEEAKATIQEQEQYIESLETDLKGSESQRADLWEAFKGLQEDCEKLRDELDDTNHRFNSMIREARRYSR